MSTQLPTPAQALQQLEQQLLAALVAYQKLTNLTPTSIHITTVTSNTLGDPRPRTLLARVDVSVE